MNPVYGNHLGIVINTDDKEKRKRIQVFIPHLNNTLFDLWNKVDDENIKNISFKDVNSLGPTIIERLKKSLPWAEAAMPLFGGGTSITSNTITGKTDVNNSKTDTIQSLGENDAASSSTAPHIIVLSIFLSISLTIAGLLFFYRESNRGQN